MTLLYNQKLMGAVAATLVVLMLTLALVFSSIDRDILEEAMPETALLAQDVPVEPEYSAYDVTDEVLWLARVIYSETKRADEQELVAWVVRNRVETQYRGVRSYRDAVLAPWQFSAFNRNAPKRAHYTSLNKNTQVAGWKTAIDIAVDVVNAPDDRRPFAKTTRHFYSERSMVGRQHPEWANGKRPVALDRTIDPRRFRFFSNIA